MNKVKYILLTLIALFLLPNSVKAASITIKCSSSSIYVGDTVTCTVAGSSAQVSAANGKISITGNLSIISANKVKCGMGDVLGSAFNCTDDVVPNELTFASYVVKATAAGSATFSVTNAAVVNETWNETPVPAASFTINVSNRPVIVQKDTTLSNVTISNVDFAFNKNAYKYNINVNHDVTSIKVNYAKSDGNQTVTLEGSEELKTGLNTIKLIVRNGSNSSVYEFNINRREEYVTVLSTDSNKINEYITDNSNSKIVIEYRDVQDKLLSSSVLDLIKKNKRIVINKVYEKDIELYEIMLDGNDINEINGYFDLNIMLNSSVLKLTNKYYNFNVTQKSTSILKTNLTLFNSILKNKVNLYKIIDDNYELIKEMDLSEKVTLEITDFANYVLSQEKIEGATEKDKPNYTLYIVFTITGVLVLIDIVYIIMRICKKIKSKKITPQDKSNDAKSEVIQNQPNSNIEIIGELSNNDDSAKIEIIQDEPNKNIEIIEDSKNDNLK